MEMEYVPFWAVTAPRFVFATMTLAPPNGSPVCAVTRPLITAACCAQSGVPLSASIAAVAHATSGVPDLRTRISCLWLEERTRKERHFAELSNDITDPLGPRPTGGRDGHQTLEAQPWQTSASSSILRGIVSRARGVCVSVGLLVGLVGTTIPRPSKPSVPESSIASWETPCPGLPCASGRTAP